MNSTVKLSNRLQKICNHLVPPYPVWDLCCDHGLIGKWAFESKAFERVFFVDRVHHIIAELRQNFMKRFELTDVPPEVEFMSRDIREIVFNPAPRNIVLAGVGAHLMNTWLENTDLSKTNRLILSPNKNPSTVKETALSKGLTLVDEFRVLEKQRSRDVYVFAS